MSLGSLKIAFGLWPALALILWLAPLAHSSANDGPIPGQFVVRLSPKSSSAQISQALGADQSLRRPTSLKVDPNRPGADDWERVYILQTTDQSVTSDDLIRQFGVSNIDYIEPVYRVELNSLPSDFQFTNQWYLHNTGQPYLAVMGVDGDNNDTLGLLSGVPGADIDLTDYYQNPPETHRRVIVAVVDTGVDPTHPDLQNVIWHNPDEIPGNDLDDDHNGFIDDTIGYDLSGDIDAIMDIVGDNDPSDYLGHGTHIAGIIAANQNDIGIAGIAPNAEIMAVKMQPNGTTAIGAAAIVYAVNSGAQVINVSWGSSFESLILRDAMAFAEANGVLVCISAGNTGALTHHYPAAFGYGLTVGATRSDGFLTSFSTFGPFVDLVAPGQDILSLRGVGTDMYAMNDEPGVHIVGDDSLYYLANGTSMAAPMVAGAAALIWSLKPHLTYDQLVDDLLAGARDMLDPYNTGDSLPGVDDYTGYGFLDIQNSLDRLHDGGVYVVSPQPAMRFIGTVDIMAASVDGYAGGWQLTYANSLAPDTWLPLGSGTSLPIDSVLLTFDGGAHSGQYTIKLTDDFGVEHLVNFTLIVDAALELTSPVPDQELDYNVPIAGSAYGPDYRAIRLYTRRDGESRELLYETGAEFFDSLIYSWNASGTVLGSYTLYAEAEFESGILTDSVSFVIASAFAEGWPQYLAGRGGLTPVAADLDNDGVKEIVVGTNYGLNVFSSNGEPYTGFPVLVGSAVRSVPAIYDVDRDGLPEIICTGDSALHVFNTDGSYASGWPVSHWMGYTAYGSPAPVVTELGFNEDSAIVLITRDGKVLAYEFDGTSYFYSLEGWYTSFNNDPIHSLYYNGNGVSGVDLDGDDANELVVTFAAEDPVAGVAVFEGRTGQPAFGRPLPYVIEALGVQGTVLADLDGDDLPEIITSGYDLANRMKIWVKKYGLYDLPGWPIELPDVVDWIGSFPTVADLDLDGTPEILAAFYEFDIGVLYAFKADGTPYRTLEGRPPGQAYRQPVTFGNPIVANLLGDDHPEVIIRTGHIFPGAGREEVHILDYSLEPIPGWPIETPTQPSQVFSTPFTPLVDDVDGDAKVEMALIGENGSLYVWDFDASVADGVNVGRLFMDNLNSSILPPERVVTGLHDGGQNGSVPRTYRLHQNYPNPFNPRTRITFETPARTRVKLEVFNILGQRVAILVDQELPGGSHTVSFDGEELASGIYLYRLQTDRYESTRKMVLLK